MAYFATSSSTMTNPSAAAYYAAREAEIAAQEALLNARNAEAQRQSQTAQQIESARTSPENAVIAQNQRLRTSTDYQYGLAGLPTPVESEAVKGEGIGIRERYVPPEERVRRAADIAEAQGALRISQAAEAVGRAGLTTERLRLQMQKDEEAAQARREAERTRMVRAKEQVEQEPRRKGGPQYSKSKDPRHQRGRGTVDPETGAWVSHDQLRKLNAERGVTFDEVNNEYVNRRELIDRLSPEGHVYRKRDGAWVNTKTGNIYKGGRWINEEDGTYMNPSDNLWRSRNGDYFDPQMKAWVQAGTGYVQQGIYWVDPSNGQKYWQGQRVKSAKDEVPDWVQSLLGQGGGTTATTPPAPLPAIPSFDW